MPDPVEGRRRDQLLHRAMEATHNQLRGRVSSGRLGKNYLPQSLMHCLRLSAHRVFSSKLRVECSWNRMRRIHEVYAAEQFAVHVNFVVVADDDVVEITAQPTRRAIPKLPDR
jgi:hypothetical protein